MSGGTATFGVSVNELRTLEPGSALFHLREPPQQELRPAAHSISLSGTRTLREQEFLVDDSNRKKWYSGTVSGQRRCRSIWSTVIKPHAGGIQARRL